MTTYLFASRDFFEVREQLLQRLQQTIASASAADIVNPDFIEQLKRKHEFRQLELHPAQAIDAPAEGPNGSIVVTLSVPFTGSPELFGYRPSKFKMGGQSGGFVAAKPGSGHDGHVKLTYQSQAADPEQYKQWKASQLASIEESVSWINHDVTTHYGAMVHTLERGLAERKDQLAKLDAFKKGIS